MNIKNLLTFTFIFSTVLNSETLIKPTSYSKDLYTAKILSSTYINSIDHPNKFLDFNYGDRVANPSQISNAILNWSKQSNKIKVVEYAKSHENRPLYAVFISSSENINNLEQIKENISQLSDARKINDRKANTIIDSLPAIAWMAYSIHGNETSGADAALGIIYHLIASDDPEIEDLLNKMVIIIDPMMNPDGRDRFAKSLEQYRGTAPNYDCLLYTSPSPRDQRGSRMPSSA